MSLGPAASGSGSAGESGGSSERELIERALRDAGELATCASGPRGRPARAMASDGMRVSFPGFEVQRELHRGGQGVVYLAVQSATRRRVAIKVPRDGPFASSQELRRFEREMEILAHLEHRNIVTILDRGVAEGRHWFAMDYVAGPTLDEWLTESRRSKEEVLRVFVKICEAVHAAHQRGIIHRDLKPANIRIDAAGEPHVLDFGLAKSVYDLGGAEMSMAGQFIGTLLWASPEQAERDPGKIDVRTDVYLLGLILFKMLTGRGPFAAAGHFNDLLEMMRDATPASPRSLSKEVDAELETIVLKCLSRERERRYQSAYELARDVERYLAGEPIDAKRDSRFYLLRKVLWRHRNLAAAALLLIVALGGLAWRESALRRRAELAERQATAAAAEAAEGRAEALEGRRRADRLLRQKAAVLDFVVADMAESVDPYEGGGADVRVLDWLRGATPMVSSRLADDLESQAEVHGLIGVMYYKLRSFTDALASFHSELEVRALIDGDDAAEATAHQWAGRAWMRQRGADPGALEHLRQTAAIRERLFGAESVEVAEAEGWIAAALDKSGDRADHEEAKRLSRRTLETYLAHLPPDDVRIAEAKHQLAVRLRDSPQEREEAVALLEQAWRLLAQRKGPEHLDTVTAEKMLAFQLLHLGRTDEARELLEHVMDADERALRDRRILPKDPRRAWTFETLADCLAVDGRAAERDGDAEAARPLFARAAALRREALALREGRPDDPNPLAANLVRLGELEMRLDRFDVAEAHLGRAVQLFQAQRPVVPRYVGEALSLWGECLARQGRPERHAQAQEALQEGMRLLLGFDPQQTDRRTQRAVERWEQFGAQAR